MKQSELDGAAIKSVADKAICAGLRVYLAKDNRYGIVTDNDGTRVVSFFPDLGRGVVFSGNYVTKNPQETGMGWQLNFNPYKDNYKELLSFYNVPPLWATKGNDWRYRKLNEHLKIFMSSGYREYNREGANDCYMP